MDNNIVRPMGQPCLEVKITKDSSGKINIDAWAKSVSPSGIVLGNKRGAAPLEIMDLCANVVSNLTASALQGIPITQREQGGTDGSEETPDKTAN